MRMLSFPSLLSRCGVLAASLLLALMIVATPATAQLGGGGGGGLGGGGGGGGLGGGGGGGLGGGGGGGLGGGGGGGGLGGGGGGGGVGSGVVVDAEGVLQRATVIDDAALSRQRIAEAIDRLPGDLAKPSKLRKVSLTRLEDAVAKRIAAGEQPTDAMQKLAGLTRIDYVFCYPETKEIVLAGPAEPWVETVGVPVMGVKTGSPVVELQDLVTAMRAFAPVEANAAGEQPLIYCSIDPTEQGLGRMQQFLTQYGRHATPGDTQFIVSQLREKLGLQEITVGGVPADTHFAQVLVEADYRMKLIGIGLEKPGAPIKSYVSRVNPAAVSRNALQRWFFVPDYQRLKTSEDHLALQVVGEGVRLIGEDELVSSDGTRSRQGVTNRASRGFVTEFTKKYAKLAAASPVYAQLRNCIDLAVVAAFMQKHDFYGQAEWSMPIFGDESTYPVRTYNAPQKVASAVNSLWKGSTLMTPIGGGVQIRPTESLAAENLTADEDGALAATRDATVLAETADWWWD